MPDVIRLQQLNEMPADEFVRRLAGVFEHSPWVASQVARERPFSSIDSLHAAMVRRVQQAGPTAQLSLIQAHPELAGKAAMAGQVTAESAREQAGAGLDLCGSADLDTLQRLNRRYVQKFGFPFILAVRGYDRRGIIAELERRTESSAAQEREESLRQIYRIARFRLQDLITD